MQGAPQDTAKAILSPTAGTSPALCPTPAVTADLLTPPRAARWQPGVRSSSNSV